MWSFYSVFVFQQLILYVEDDSSKPDDRMANQMCAASEERREVLEVNKVRSLFFMHSLWIEPIDKGTLLNQIVK